MNKDILKYVGNYLKETGTALEDFMAEVKTEMERPKKHRYYIEYHRTTYDDQEIDAYNKNDAISEFYSRYDCYEYTIDSVEDEGEIVER